MDGQRFSYIERLREDPTIPEIFGMESVVGDVPDPLDSGMMLAIVVGLGIALKPTERPETTNQ